MKDKAKTRYPSHNPEPMILRDEASGVVERNVHPEHGRLSSSQMIYSVQMGLPMFELDRLQALLGMPMDSLAPKLGLSRATFHRRRQEGRLDPSESDKVVRYARLFGKAREIFKTDDQARDWLTSPQYGLGGVVPIDMAQTEVGAREVENLLTRIDYSVYS